MLPKRAYAKPELQKREALSSITAQALLPISGVVDNRQ